ncbi:hypothetical protein DL765_009713 [Monosporascus sp. GIB2]|nr:hypothetical protein DL765_009713 [Monosporascus sp. GIB2]
MQFKNAALLLSAIPAAVANLPPTLELLVFQNGQRIGCVDINGKFVTNARTCFPFRAMVIPGSNNKHLWSVYGGKCSADSGVLECYAPSGEPSEFTLNGADLELIGAGTAFSANSIPALASAGADIIVGDSGSEKFFLQVRPVSG